MGEHEAESAPAQSAAGKVAAGILSSRIVGFLRERAVAHFLGVGAHADVLSTAFRGPNLLQNLLGEGTISAAFIPIYSTMLAEGRPHDAGRFAGAIFGLLLAAAAGLSLMGFLLAEPIVAILTPGYLDDAAKVAAGELSVNRYTLSVMAVRIIFPMTGVLVLSAWALGILNSHRRFLVPYLAPVLWNLAQIAALFAVAYYVIVGPVDSVPARTDLLFAACWGALAGGVLQFGVQLPFLMREMKGFRLSFSTKVEGVRESLRAFGPVVAGRGVYQLSGYLDLFLASFLAEGALSAMRYSQMLYMLPVGLFGLSVAAAELPELSRIREQNMAPFIERMERSLRQMMFLTVPTVIGYLAFGFLLVGALYRTGEFEVNDNWLVYAILVAYTLGLLATTASRLLQNASYALRDTKTPAKIAAVRVVISAAAAVPLMFWLDQFRVSDFFDLPANDGLFLGAAGLAGGSALGAWTELALLSRFLRRRIPTFHTPWTPVLKMIGLAVAVAVPPALVWYVLPAWHVAVVALIVVGLYGLLYVGAAQLLGFSEVEAWTGRLLHRFRRR